MVAKQNEQPRRNEDIILCFLFTLVIHTTYLTGPYILKSMAKLFKVSSA